MKISTLLFLAIAASGCATFRAQETPTITFHADRRFSPDERSCIQDAADQWADQTDGQARFELKYDVLSNGEGNITGADLVHDSILRWNSGLAQVKQADYDLSTALGEPSAMILGNCSHNLYDNVAGFRLPITIHVVSDRIHSQNLCKGVVMHEMGHSLGMNHVEEWPGDIMYHASTHEKDACLKKADLAEYCRVQGDLDCMTHTRPCTATPEEVGFFGEEP